MIKSDLISVSEEIEQALAKSEPVVALESTVIAHGLPRPKNFETALSLEGKVRAAGAVPATIAVIEGSIRVGLTHEQLQRIAERDDVHKLSVRDIAVAVAERWDGATTVASTMWIANRAGIGVFATGGIGGVHRGQLPDISADLVELARTPMVVACSGAKIVLDLPATREWLETHGVTVIGYRTDEFPAFYSRSSGLPVDINASSATRVASIVNTHWRLGVASATILAVPIPSASEIPIAYAEQLLAEAMSEAATEKIGGRDVTPFLLAHMNRASAGRLVEANIALLENNAAVSAEVARALCFP